MSPTQRGPHPRTLAAHNGVLTFLEEGATLAEACKRAGVSYQTVKNHASDDPEFRRQIEATGWQGRRGRRPNTSWHQAALDAIAAGASYYQAGRKAGIHPQKIWDHRRRDPQFAAELERATQAGKAARAARKSTPKPSRQLKPCGTTAAYHRHLANGEKPCEKCRKAQTAYAIALPSFQIAMKAAREARRQLTAKHRAEYEELVRQEKTRTDKSLRNAYSRAALALARRHPEEFRTLVAAERDAIRRDQEKRGRPRKPVSRWRQGERDDAARTAHNAETRKTRQRAVREAFRPVERRLLVDIAAGVPLADAARRAGVTVQATFNRARWDTRWAQRLDAALTAGRNPDISHGTEHAYRVHKCRCPDCRAAKARYR